MEADDDFDMQLIGHFLSCASRGDKVGLNQMLREGCSPNVQDYDHRTALHLAASEGHASIVELLLHYKANVNLKDRWKRTTLQHERGMSEVNIEASELNLMHSSIIEQGLFGESEKVKWRGTWVVQTRIKRHIIKPVELILSAKDITLLRELRHPNIVQFLGSLEQGEEIFLITEYLSKGNLHEILTRRIRFDFNTSVRYALDIARGINYLHEHKPYPIVHNNLSTRNLLQDEGGHLKIGEYWVQMLYERTHPHQEDRDGINSNSIHDTKKDIYLFANIFYQMLEGEILHSELARLKSSNVEPKFKLSRCPMRIRELVKACRSMDPSKRPTFAAVIEILEEASGKNSRSGCPVC
ncbi:non-specific serine/threonine protein kinase [Ranunculus cassubicifolius]